MSGLGAYNSQLQSASFGPLVADANGNTHLDPVKPQMNHNGDIAGSETGGTIIRRQPIEDDLAEIKHPLSAIMANADAARRWLNRTNPNFYEAIAALDRIVRESIRIDDAIAGIRALPAAENPAKRLV